MDQVAILVTAPTGPGVLHQLTGVIARHGGDISSVEISYALIFQGATIMKILIVQILVAVLTRYRPP